MPGRAVVSSLPASSRVSAAVTLRLSTCSSQPASLPRVPVNAVSFQPCRLLLRLLACLPALYSARPPLDIPFEPPLSFQPRHLEPQITSEVCSPGNTLPFILAHFRLEAQRGVAAVSFQPGRRAFCTLFTASQA